MSAVADRPMPVARPRLKGRLFVNAPFDYLLIGGGLSLIAVGAMLWLDPAAVDPRWLVVMILCANSAHFAASTMRLYTKPGAFQQWPFLTMVLPLLSVVAVTVGVAWPEYVGWNLNALYLTWSPFHYAAQAFGLACMYHYRSGGSLDRVERNLVYATCMLPFLYALVDAATTSRTGLGWFLPRSVLISHPAVGMLFESASDALAVLIFAAPLVVAVRLARNGRNALPLISWLIILTNGIWWVVFRYLEAFAWATVFHGIQYLAIVMLFHAKERTAMTGNRHGAAYHALVFYGACLVLGYLIFNVWPYAYVGLGYGFAESMLTCAAVINIHHFVVDRYIWRVRRDASNEAVVRSD